MPAVSMLSLPLFPPARHDFNLQAPAFEGRRQFEKALIPLNGPEHLRPIPLTGKGSLPIAMLHTALIMPGRSHRAHMIKAETASIDGGEISAAKKYFHDTHRAILNTICQRLTIPILANCFRT